MKPRIFIASSLEGKAIANALQVNLYHDARCTVWNQAFPLSMNTMDTLLLHCAENDFAIFVFSNDDEVKMRTKGYAVVRDNVVFESGLFMGMNGKDRGFIVVPENVPDFHMPTNLLGLTTADYDAKWAKKEPTPALGAVATKINEAINRSSWTTLRRGLHITGKGTLDPKATFPLKLQFRITNDNMSAPVAIASISFELGPGLRIASNAHPLHHKPRFLIGRGLDGKDIYEDRCIVEPSKSVISCWMPIDPTIGEAALNAAIKGTVAGTWDYRCYWLDRQVIACSYEEEF